MRLCTDRIIQKNGFAEFDMDVLNWSALSPDLNPIEYVRSALARAVYSSLKQFNSATHLKKTIEDKWACMSTAIFKKYIENMRDRCLSVIKSHGAKISY